jgi:hypothetical protein
MVEEESVKQAKSILYMKRKYLLDLSECFEGLKTNIEIENWEEALNYTYPINECLEYLMELSNP